MKVKNHADARDELDFASFEEIREKTCVTLCDWAFLYGIRQKIAKLA